MGTVYSAYETKIRVALADPAGGSQLLSAADLDAHIDHAAQDLSQAAPLAKLLAPTATNGSRVIDLTASLSGLALVRVIAVEWPISANPKNWVEWELFGNTLTLMTPTAPTAVTVNVYARIAMVVTSSSGTSTVPGEYDELLARRASAYAAQEIAATKMNTINIGGPAVWEHYLALSQAILADTDKGLAALGARPLYFAGKRHAPMFPPQGEAQANLNPGGEIFP